MKTALVLRPEPGATETAARLAAAGVATIKHPLFAVAPVAWTPPDPARFDALLLTSANAARHAGPALAALASLPVLAVGRVTGDAARAAGLRVVLTGEQDAAALLAAARGHGFMRPLHLAGRDRVAPPGVEAITVYASDPVPLAPDAVAAWAERVALLHSARAARRFAALVGADRAGIAVAALSPSVAAAAGEGWAETAVADQPNDAALVACAAALIDRAGGRVDKSTR